MSIPRRNFPPEGVLDSTSNSPVLPRRGLFELAKHPVEDAAVLVVA